MSRAWSRDAGDSADSSLQVTLMYSYYGIWLVPVTCRLSLDFYIACHHTELQTWYATWALWLI